MKIFVLLLLAILVLSGCLGLDLNDHGNTCEYSDDIYSTLSAERISVIRVNAAAGDLYIRQNDADEVSIHGFLCASTQSDLDRIDLITTVDTAEIEITADLSQVRRNASLDLNLRIPKAVKLVITDSSGDILIENISNDIYLEDGSGNIRIFNNEGLVNLTDGSGNIEIDNIHDNVTILADGSGNIDIAQVTGDVYIAMDGSGNITVKNVLGDFRLGQDGSGSVNYANIAGRVYLP